jgi:hypothetical protein
MLPRALLPRALADEEILWRLVSSLQLPTTARRLTTVPASSCSTSPGYAVLVAVSRTQPGAFLADWRHLGVLPRSGRALVIGGVYPDLQSVFEATEVPGWDEIPEPPQTFQLIIVAIRLESRDSVASIERVLDPSEGVVVICTPHRRARTGLYRPMAIQARSARRLLRGTRLEAQAVYGALPDAWVPEYVFPFTRAAAAFAIERFLLSRRPAWGWIRATLRWGPIVGLAMSALPGGFIVCRLRGDGP